MPLVEAGIRSKGNSSAGAAALRTRGQAPANAVVANPPSNCRRVINGVPSFRDAVAKDSPANVSARCLPSAGCSASIVDEWQIPCLLLLFALFGSTPPPGCSAPMDFLAAAAQQTAAAE